MPVVDFFHVLPQDLKSGDLLICTIKCIIVYEADVRGKPMFRLYRCLYRPDYDVLHGEPQGTRIMVGVDEVAKSIFPVLGYAELQASP